MTSETILITGGTGFAGSHLVEALLVKNYHWQRVANKDIHVTSFTGNPGYISKILPKENIHQLDLTDSKKTSQLFKKIKPTQIYHLASFASPGASLENMRMVLQSNTDIQLSVLEAMKQETPKARMLCVCSATEYAASSKPLTETSLLGPHNPYGVSKVTQDMLAHSYAKKHGLDIVRVRPFNHIGERQALGFVVSDFAHQIAEIEKNNQKDKASGGEMKVGNLEVWRDFSDVKDVVLAYITVMEKGTTAEVYNIGSGEAITVSNILKKLKQQSSVEFSVVVEDTRRRPGEIIKAQADISKIKQLGWEPKIPLDETLTRVLDYWRKSPLKGEK